MSKIAVVYWSGTGNTKKMAEFIVKGVKDAGAEAAIFTADAFNSDMINEYDGIAFGCPSMGAEQLEESEFEPMFQSCESKLSGKKLGLFGSYGWGDGEWMRSFEQVCESDGAMLVSESVICNEDPDSEAEKACIDLGMTLAKA